MDLFLGLAIGTWAGWATAVGVIAMFIFMWRGQAGPALGYISQANRVLTDQVEELQKKDKEKDKKIAELQAKTDVTIALQPLYKWTEAHDASVEKRNKQMVAAMNSVVSALNSHEDRETQRHEQFLGLIELVADRLGPEKNGVEHAKDVQS